MSLLEDDVITLNVGGTRFETRRSTLLREPKSLLAQMFEPDMLLRNESDTSIIQEREYFIDRDPDRFKLLLNQLRDFRYAQLLDVSNNDFSPQDKDYTVVSPHATESDYDELYYYANINHYSIREKREKADTEKENDVDDKNDWGTELTRQQLLVLRSEARYFELAQLEAAIDRKLDVLHFKVGGTCFEVKKSLFGNMPVSVIEEMLRTFRHHGYKIKEVVEHAIKVVPDHEEKAVNIDCDPTEFKDVIVAIRKRLHHNDLTKDIIFLRYYIYSDLVAIKIGDKIFESRRTTVCKDPDSHASHVFNMTSGHTMDKGYLVIYNHYVCWRNRMECKCKLSLHVTEECVHRILSRLSNAEISDSETPEHGTKLYKESEIASCIGLLSGHKWFYQHGLQSTCISPSGHM